MLKLIGLCLYWEHNIGKHRANNSNTLNTLALFFLFIKRCILNALISNRTQTSVARSQMLLCEESEELPF